MSAKSFLTISALAVMLGTGACAETPATPTTPAAADVDGATAVTAQTAQTDPSQQVTCQTDDDTGSHLRKKTICTTAEQDAQNRAAIEASRSFRQSGQGSAGH